jgi:hypothetical protein
VIFLRRHAVRSADRRLDRAVPALAAFEQIVVRDRRAWATGQHFGEMFGVRTAVVPRLGDKDVELIARLAVDRRLLPPPPPQSSGTRMAGSRH